MRYIIIHDADHDGYASAWLIMQHLKPEGVSSDIIETHAIRAGNNTYPEIQKGDHVYIVDRSYSLETLLLMSHFAAHVTVIDHHKTFLDSIYEAYKDTEHLTRVESFNAELCSLICTVENLEIKIDTREAACSLVRDFLNKEIMSILPGYDDFWFINYIADRDIWKFALPMSQEINAGIHTFPLDFNTFDKLYHGEITPEQCEERGIGIVAYRNMLFSTMTPMVEKDKETFFPKLKVSDHVVVAECPFSPLISDFGSHLLNHFVDSNIAVLWHHVYDLHGTRQFHYSVRSNIDTSSVAKFMGGGGHANANGFRSATIQPSAVACLYKNLLEEHYNA